MRSFVIPTSLLTFALLLRLPFLNLWPSYVYDEGVVIEAGLALHKGIFGLFAYHPLISGFGGLSLSYLVTSFTTAPYIQRVPYAIIGGFCSLVVYYIFKSYNSKLAILSSIFLSVSPIIYINRTSEPVTATELFFLLPILFYTRYRTNGKNKYWILAGVCGGLGFLFDYVGVVSFFFLLFQVLIDRRKPLWKSMVMLAINLLVAFTFLTEIFIVGYSNFTAEFLRYGSSSSISVAVFNFILGYPSGQLSPPIYIDLTRLFMLLGFFVTTLYATWNLGKAFLISALISTFIVFYLGSGLFNWIFFAILIPLYCIGIADLVLFLASKKVTIPLRLVGMLTMMILVITLIFYYGGNVGNTNTGFDCAVSYLTAHPAMTAAIPYLADQLPQGYNYAEVLFYNHPYNYHEWYVGMQSLSTVNLSLSRFTYFVMDNILSTIALDQWISYHSTSINDTLTTIRSNWSLVEACGQYLIYKQ